MPCCRTSASRRSRRYGWLQAGRDARRPGHGRDDARPADHGRAVRRLPGRLSQSRRPFDPLAAGVLGSVVTTWVTFVPCFLWIFLGAPYIERLRGQASGSAAPSRRSRRGRRRGAEPGGLVLDPHAVRGCRRNPLRPAHLRWFQPDWATLSWPSLAIAVVAAIILFRTKWGMFAALGAGVALGVGCYCWVCGVEIMLGRAGLAALRDDANTFSEKLQDQRPTGRLCMVRAADFQGIRGRQLAHLYTLADKPPLPRVASRDAMKLGKP